jgi:predicted ester cyclase
MNKKITLVIATIAIFLSITSLKAKILTQEQLMVKSFYEKVLTVNSKFLPEKVLGDILANNFQSIDINVVKDKKTMISQMQGLWKVIPDLKWEVQEVLQDGDKIIVRSIFSGTPKGSFLGLTLDGTKSFKSMSIDIHTVEKGKIVQIYHIEDWISVMQQLTAK